MIDLILFFQLAIWALFAWRFAFSRTASLFHPFLFYLAFHGLVFVLRPFLVYYGEFSFAFYYMGFYPDEADFIKTLVVTNVALCVFAFASWFWGHAEPKFQPELAASFSAAERLGFLITLGMLGPLALYSAVVGTGTYSFENAGEIQMVRDVATGHAGYTNTTGYLLDAQNMLSSLCLILIWLNRFRLWSFAPLLAFVGYRAFVGWGRYAIVLSLASLALLYLYRNRKRWPYLRYALLAIPVFMLFEALGEQRDLVRYMVTGEKPYTYEPGLDPDRSWMEKQDNLDFANFEYLTAVVDVVPARSGGYTYFTQYLQLFTEPIPRQLWPEKPFGSPIQWVNLNEHLNFEGLTTSLVGDGWISWGWFGVVLSMAAVGAFLGKLHRWFWRHGDNRFVVLGYCIFLPLTVQWFRDGGISIVKFAGFTLLPIFCWMAVAKFIQMSQAGSPRLVRRGAETLPEPRGH